MNISSAATDKGGLSHYLILMITYSAEDVFNKDTSYFNLLTCFNITVTYQLFLYGSVYNSLVLRIAAGIRKELCNFLYKESHINCISCMVTGPVWRVRRLTRK